VGKPEDKRIIGNLRLRWQDNIKTVLKEIGWEDVDYFDVAQNLDKWLAFVNTVIKTVVA
jgi:hypothetical protein